MPLDRLKLPIVLAAGIIAVSFASSLIKFSLAEKIPPASDSSLSPGLGFPCGRAFSLGAFQPRDKARQPRRVYSSTRPGVFLALHFALWISSTILL
jgi:hypothetical protein